MPEESLDLTALVKSGITGARKSVHEISNVIASAAAVNLVHAVQGTGNMTAAVFDIVRGSLNAVDQAGVDAGTAAEAIVIGMARNAQQAAGNWIETVRQAAGAVIQVTVEIQGDIVKTARGVVDGAASAAREINHDAAEAVSVAAAAAVEATANIDARTADLVRAAVRHASRALADRDAEPRGSGETASAP